MSLPDDRISGAPTGMAGDATIPQPASSRLHGGLHLPEGLRYPLAVGLTSRVAVYLLIAVFGWTTRRPKGSGFSYQAFFAPLSLWDAKWYSWIASYGYDPLIAHGNTMAFFPMFPLMWRILETIPGPATLAVSIVNSALFVAAVVTIHAQTRNRFNARFAQLVTLLVCIFPTSFVYSLPYAESVFLLAVALTFRSLERSRLLQATLLGAVAIAARPLGIFLIPAIVVNEARRSGYLSKRSIASTLALAGTYCAVLGYFAWSSGDMFANGAAEHRGWNRQLTLPITFAWQVMTNDVVRHHHLRGLLDILFACLWIVLLIRLVRMRVPAEYVLFSGLLVIVPVADGSLLSMGRLGMVAFPLFWGLGSLVERSESRMLGVLLVSAACLPVVMYLALGSQSYVP